MDTSEKHNSAYQFLIISLVAVFALWFGLRFGSTTGIGLMLLGLAFSGAVYGIFRMRRHRKALELTFAQGLAYWPMWLLVKLRYRVNIEGLENMPREGKVLVISNHVSYMDAVVLGVCLPRKLRFLSNDTLQTKPILGPMLRLAGVVPVSPTKARAAIRTAVEKLDEGEAVVIFPEGHLTRDGLVAPFQDGFRLIARKANAPVLPVYLDGLWGSIFSFEGGRFFWKLPRRGRPQIRIVVGNPISTDMSAAEARQTVLDHGADAFQEKPELTGHLGGWVIDRLSERLDDIAVVDHAMGRKEMKAGVLCAVALNLSQSIREHCPEKRVGIVLPPGLGGIIANLAVSLAGKTPVNLNFTLGKAALERCFEKAELRTVISAAAVRTQIDGRMPGFPWPEHTLDVKEMLEALPKWKIIKTLIGLKLTGSKAARRRFDVPERGDNAEAALLFTSGSDGDPKGVVLTHRNIIGNALQVTECGVLPKGETLMANLPIFHSFGFTVQIWTALGVGVKVVATPSPLDFKKAADAIEQEQCTILLGTPTFFRPYLKRVEPEKLKTLKIVVAGAEKTPAGFHDAWEERFPGSHYLEGYGLTETTPVVSCNVPDVPSDGQAPATIRKRRGSVGKLFKGMAARIECPDSGQELPIDQVGILCLRGVNIFDGYLGDPERTKDVIDDEGWFRTGDLARCDSDGFLYIEGRLSRFSKIGGEMVPHGTVETTLAKAFDVAESETPQMAVSARNDDAKGEALVLFTTLDIDEATVRDKAKDAGLANLWTPKIVRKVEVIPMLPTGKLDLKGLKKLAEEA
ncbi:AMP-binding protein [Cerasicoccus fimbriatus]|uniref:AMP-binding protein n=1 Tax=Cerasicoccus fimbriatus TaxID=3014554 RepID=UPI0022B38A61|nr:AMP-binding protein [Cerasicoccus sp. TK19100]